MAIHFNLRPPLPENVFDDNEKRTEALITSIFDDINHALEPEAHCFSDTQKSIRDGDGGFMRDADTPQGVFDNMHGMALAYLGHRMGDALEMDVHQGEETHNIGLADKKKKEGYV